MFQRSVVLSGWLLAILSLATTVRAGDDAQVVPNAAASNPGSTSFLGPLANAQRTYQLLIHADQLSAIQGQRIVGLSWRLPPAATSSWPAAPINYDDYDIYLSGSVAPADRSFTFAENVVGPQQQVRSGSLEIAAEAYPSGDSPNAFGPVIELDEWQYDGGNLLIELRHSGFTGTSRSVDAIGTSAGTGYGDQFSATWTGSYSGTSGAQGNFAVIRLIVEGNGGGDDAFIIGNLPEDNDDAASTGIDDLRQQAIRFTMPADASAIAGSVTLRVSDYDHKNGAVVQLRDAGALLQEPGENVLLSFSPGLVRGTLVGEVLFLPDATYHLQPDTSYWLVVSGSASSPFNWHGSDPGLAPVGLASFDLYAETDDGVDWSVSDVYNSLRFAPGDDVIFADGFELDD